MTDSMISQNEANVGSVETMVGWGVALIIISSWDIHDNDVGSAVGVAGL